MLGMKGFSTVVTEKLAGEKSLVYGIIFGKKL